MHSLIKAFGGPNDLSAICVWNRLSGFHDRRNASGVLQILLANMHVVLKQKKEQLLITIQNHRIYFKDIS